MKVDGVKNQSFGINPSNAVRKCMVEAALNGKDIKPFITAMKDIYPYKFMTMLGDSKRVQAVGLTDSFEALPHLGKKLPKKWQPEYEKHLHDTTYWASGRPYKGKYLDYEGSQLFEERAVPAILPPDRDGKYIFLFNNLNGKPFAKIIDSLTENLRKIKEGLTPSQKIANDIEQEFPQYRNVLTEKRFY